MEGHRQTLVSNGPLGNMHAGSSIPVPASAMKKPASRIPSSRFSMAPNAGAIGSTAPQSRMSMMPSHTHGSAGMARTMNQENMARRSIMSNRDQGAPLGNRGDASVYGKTPARAPPQRYVKTNSQGVCADEVVSAEVPSFPGNPWRPRMPWDQWSKILDLFDPHNSNRHVNRISTNSCQRLALRCP